MRSLIRALIAPAIALLMAPAVAVPPGTPAIPAPTAPDQVDVRQSDGAYAAIDLNFRGGTLWTGRIRPSAALALGDLGAVYTRASIARHLDGNRLLTAYPLDTPALGYQMAPIVAVRGLSLERTSFNLFSTSTGTAIWNNASNASNAASPVAGPDGALNLSRVTQTATNGYMQSTNFSVPGDNSLWTFSAILPKTTTSQQAEIQLVLTGGSAATVRVYFDLSGLTAPGDLGTTTGSAFGQLDLGNYWLIWGARAVGANTTAQVRFFPTTSGSGLTGTADIGHLQFEPGDTATSRIVTSGTARIRRERDTLTIPVPALTAAGTIEVTASPPGGATARVLAQVDDGTQANRVTIQRSAAGNIQALWVAAGATIATMDLGAHVGRSETRVAVGWSGGTIKAIRDGAALGVAAVAPPPGLRTLRLGGDAVTTSLDGPVARVSVWPGLRTDVFYEAPTASFAVFGDSMAAGSGTSTVPEHWNDILATNLKRGYVNNGVGGSTSSQALANYLSGTSWRAQTLLIFTGHNAPNSNQTIADIQGMIAAMSGDPVRKRYLIGVPTVSPSAANGGAAGLNATIATGAAIKTTWPDRYVDIPAALTAAALAAGDTAQSDPNIAAGLTPARYLADTIHLNAAGQIVEEAAWRAALLAKGW